MSGEPNIPQEAFAPDVFVEMSKLLREASGSPSLALRLSVWRSRRDPKREYYETLAKVHWASLGERQRRRLRRIDPISFSILKGLGG